MPDAGFLFKVSRPRFWLYVFGPYLIGLAAGAASKEDFFRIDSIIFGLYFLLPANLLIYGINDIFDFETDRLNPKKSSYEILVGPESHRSLAVWIILLNLPFIAAAYFIAPQTLPSLAGFIFFSVFYSAPPMRAKTIPIVDSIFNILYIFSGAFSYQMLTGLFPPFAVLLAAGLWTMSMHAYSAIPDVDSDREAGLSTVATLLGKNGTLLFCLLAYLSSAVLAFAYLGYFAVVMGAVYVFMIAISFLPSKEDRVFLIYRYFPLLNAGVGFLLFWFVALKLA